MNHITWGAGGVRPASLSGRIASGMLLVFACTFPAAARLSPWQGTVTHVSDGDTVWVQPSRGGAPRKIRIDGIDAPEICQHYGQQARMALADRLLGQSVQVVSRRKDDYGRWLARVRRHEQDVGHWMVSQGHAWSYRYRQSRGRYAVEEAQARTQGLGLWQQDRPVPPRVFRQRHGPCH